MSICITVLKIYCRTGAAFIALVDGNGIIVNRMPALLGAVLAGGAFVITSFFGDIGGGDIKLAFGIGMWFGWHGGASVILLGCLLATVWSIPQMMKSGIRNVRVPLGAFLGIAAWAYVLAQYLT